MKINQTGLTGINPYQKQLNKVSAQQKTAEMKADKLEISSAAKDMQGASKIVAERQEKIAALKQQVATGEYTPKAEDIAKGIINFYKR